MATNIVLKEGVEPVLKFSPGLTYQQNTWVKRALQKKGIVVKDSTPNEMSLPTVQKGVDLVEIARSALLPLSRRQRN